MLLLQVLLLLLQVLLLLPLSVATLIRQITSLALIPSFAIHFPLSLCSLPLCACLQQYACRYISHNCPHCPQLLLPAGKTVQAIGFIAAVLGKMGGQDDHNQPELQVCVGHPDAWK